MRDLGVFKKDISDTLIKYPKLTLSFNNEGDIILKGEIDIFYDNGDSYVAFLVLIKISKKYPFTYPTVWEIGKMFPKEQSFHYLDNNALCLDVKQSIAIKAKMGIKIVDFIEKDLIPNLAWRYCVLKDIPFERKEYKHGLEGVIQEYQEILETQDDSFLFKCLCAVALNKLPERNETCLCGNQKKFKNCHETSIQHISKMPINILRSDVTKIYQFLKFKYSK